LTGECKLATMMVVLEETTPRSTMTWCTNERSIA